MPNAEHLQILRQGVEVWRMWRKQHPEILPNLLDADLSGADLCDAYFRYAHLGRVNFRQANLSRADLIGALLNGANLSYADLSHADLRGVKFGSANLSNASLNNANLSYTIFQNPILSCVDFTDTYWGGTILSEVDLSEVRGLDTVIHTNPSTIGVETIYQSRGNIPEVFLRGCGLSDWQVENAKLYSPELSSGEIINILYRVHNLRAHQAIQISPLFISYSHADGAFVDRMEAHLNERGVRFWRDTHHTTAGRLEKQVDRAIRLNPTVLLILSEHSVQSDWVQHEARLARKLEIETKRDVLCPVALDDSWKDCDWPVRLREQIMEYNILDFSKWKDEDSFRRMFGRLLDGLDLFYK